MTPTPQPTSSYIVSPYTDGHYIISSTNQSLPPQYHYGVDYFCTTVPEPAPIACLGYANYQQGTKDFRDLVDQIVESRDVTSSHIKKPEAGRDVMKHNNSAQKIARPLSADATEFIPEDNAVADTQNTKTVEPTASSSSFPKSRERDFMTATTPEASQQEHISEPEDYHMDDLLSLTTILPRRGMYDGLMMLDLMGNVFGIDDPEWSISRREMLDDAYFCVQNAVLEEVPNRFLAPSNKASRLNCSWAELARLAKGV